MKLDMEFLNKLNVDKIQDFTNKKARKFFNEWKKLQEKYYVNKIDYITYKKQMLNLMEKYEVLK